MVDFLIYAVKKDSDDSITHCYLSDKLINSSFDNKMIAKRKIKEFCFKQ